MNQLSERYLEDFAVGQTFGSGRLRIDGERALAFAAEFDPQPFHLDEAVARRSIFGGLTASGWHTTAVTMRLLIEGDLQPAGGFVGVGLDECHWPRPVRPGDELRVACEVLEVRPSKSRPKQGLVKIRTTTLNQDDEAVLVHVLNLVVLRRKDIRQEPVIAAIATPLLAPASAQAEGVSQAGAAPLNGNGFYRFAIGDFQATVISDGSGQIPVAPIFVMNASEAELASVLKANFMQPVIQVTNNILVVDTGRERILVDTGFGEKLGPSFGSFPGLEANLRRAGIAPDSIDLVVTSHGHLDHIGGLVTKSGALTFPKAQFVFVDTEWNYWTGSRYESDVNSSPMPDPFKEGTIAAARDNLPPVANRSRFVKQGGEITTGVHYIAAPGHSPCHAAILFASGKEQFLHMGDIAHNPVTSLQHPDWTPVFDYDAAQAIESRKAILDRVATDQTMVLGYHFPFPAIGHVVRRDAAYHWEAAQWIW
jgi:acyl dehydratase/glyoxylase-like metal-dependent hydrolase (beta-lactamase superfamily II)